MRIAPPALLQPTHTRNRLWQGGIALAIFILTLAIGNNFVSSEKAVTTDMLGLDFLPFYESGVLARTHHAEQLYDIPAVAAMEKRTASAVGIDLGEHFGPFWNPPFYAWVFAPISQLPFRQALAVWTLINVAALGASVFLLVRMLPQQANWKVWTLIPLLILTSVPFIQAISHGQNTFTSLLLLCLTVTAWRSRRAILAGAFCGLLCYKPQHAALLGLVLTLSMGWRTIIGLASVLIPLALITMITMPGSIADWTHQLPLNVHFMQIERMYNWDRHATLKAFWRMTFMGQSIGESTRIVVIMTAATTAIGVAALLSAIWQSHADMIDNCWTGETRQVRLDRLIAATIAVTPLVMPFYFDYDLLLLAVPAVLFGGEMASLAPGQPRTAGDQWLVWSWIGLYAFLMVHGPLAHVVGMGLIAPPLAVVATLSLTRSCRRPKADPSPTWVTREITEILHVRRAA